MEVNHSSAVNQHSITSGDILRERLGVDYKYRTLGFDDCY